MTDPKQTIAHSRAYQMRLTGDHYALGCGGTIPCRLVVVSVDLTHVDSVRLGSAPLPRQGYLRSVGRAIGKGLVRGQEAFNWQRAVARGGCLEEPRSQSITVGRFPALWTTTLLP